MKITKAITCKTCEKKRKEKKIRNQKMVRKER
jgi:hypothetical protein